MSIPRGIDENSICLKAGLPGKKYPSKVSSLFPAASLIFPVLSLPQADALSGRWPIGEAVWGATRCGHLLWIPSTQRDIDIPERTLRIRFVLRNFSYNCFRMSPYGLRSFLNLFFFLRLRGQALISARPFHYTGKNWPSKEVEVLSTRARNCSRVRVSFFPAPLLSPGCGKWPGTSQSREQTDLASP